MTDFHDTLRSLRVWDTELPAFDPDSAPAAPLPLFHQWLVAAARAGQAEPHTMALATVDAEGRPDVRTVMLHDADARGWHFASHATSAKGRQLAAAPHAALGFYWPVQGRQVRVRGQVVTGTPQEAYDDLHARSTGALAAALVGRQSEVLGSTAELARAGEAAWERAEAEPDADVETWTLYILEPYEVEFFQGDARRRHLRLRYRRTPAGDWERGLLWP
ncbi:pyridoxal 5'-phosphate synthase [Streptomyces sp. WAC05374]|uniref:pyridoxine/pyridoxamine 5'-phosphate oxidase n=1 Tax=Streptomyces sp. WAC05374 TaxID=2487420 RepID=UPI000F8931F9|nr:pyridoxal 5'-phosphate synthase [Streptomyces sp. WAC05374]RST11661.1 pyridoxal 5'-phosphate synthase [Streptomyces sp. WAC05374]TDF47160.1 pyridoxal 5'-phosphate synthase [Streptomyces sp. WAC05374]TDF57418.1 pyridoxal 5'-phosphate synthase [Streptomyces sp. WAC05374]TDF61523.1 pyridoxal 5'-phosphate synthase [Streptomyces sp. WAC05374]